MLQEHCAKSDLPFQIETNHHQIAGESLQLMNSDSGLFF